MSDDYGSYKEQIISWYIEYSSNFIFQWTMTRMKELSLEPQQIETQLNSINMFTLQAATIVSSVERPLLHDSASTLNQLSLSIEIKSRLYPIFANIFKDTFLTILKARISFWLQGEEGTAVELALVSSIFTNTASFRSTEILERDIVYLLQTAIQIMIMEKSGFESSYLNEYLDFLTVRVSPIIYAVFGESSNVAKSWMHRLECHIYQILPFHLMENIFEIVRDYPDSHPILSDLKLCLEKSGQFEELELAIKAKIRERLLIIDAKTQSILTMFLSISHVLSFLELNDVAKEKIMIQIKKYLVTRNDVTRIILMKILDSNSEDEELEEGDINMLLDICPTITDYVKDYQLLLCEQLLKLLDFDVDQQIRDVEILKSRFGELEMSQSSVMMKDVADSRRIMNYHFSRDSHHRIHMQQDRVFTSVLVISNLFWPKIDQTVFKVPEIVMEWIERFEESFEATKVKRKLKWAPNAGIVDLQVGDMRVKCSPLQASLVLLFKHKDEILISDATGELECSLGQLKTSVDYWNGHGVLFLSGDFIVTTHSERLTERTKIESNAIENSGLFASERERNYEQEIEEIWPMLNGMLINLGPSTLEVIHRTLSMFITDFNLSNEKLGKVLQAMVERDLLEKDGRDTFKIKT